MRIGRREVANELRDLITEPFIEVNEKNVPAFKVENHTAKLVREFLLGNSRNKNHTAEASSVPAIALYNKLSETAVASPWNPEAKFMASSFAPAEAGSAVLVRRR